MTVGSSKNKKSVDKLVSEAINEAFDTVELSTVGKLCLDARLNKGLTQEQAAALLKVRVKIIKDLQTFSLLPPILPFSHYVFS